LKYLKELDQTKVATIVLEMIDYLKETGKRIILMGFSLGSSMALKLLEYTQDVELAFLFYGIPPL
jgi:dienelactone hydrolase